MLNLEAFKKSRWNMDVLKGNFKVKEKTELIKNEKKSNSFDDEFLKKAIENI